MKKITLLMVAVSFVLAATMLAGDAVAGDGKTKKKKESIAEKFKRLDTNNDGKLNKEEFSRFEPNKKKYGTSKRTTNRDKFLQFDKNNDNVISAGEFQKIFEYRAKL